MAEKLLVILANADPSQPGAWSTPLFQATVAASLEYEVEVVLTGRAAELARRGVAEKLLLQPGGDRSVYDFIREAHEAGVRFKVCTPSQELAASDLITEIDGIVDSAYPIDEAMADRSVTFTY